VVAALDYLCNLTKDIHATTLIGEKHNWRGNLRARL
jgi:hypothetical protein